MKVVNFIIALVSTISMTTVVDLIVNCALQNTDFTNTGLGEQFWRISTNLGRFCIGWFIIAEWGKDLYEKMNAEISPKKEINN